MLLFTCHLLFDHFQFTLIHGSNIPGSYALLFFTASDFTSINSHIHSWALFLLWLCLFILSGVISPLFSSSILGTYWSGEFLFQYPIILPFHAVHGKVQAAVTGDRSKVPCCKEQYCIGTWNVRSMNQGKLEVIKQEMARVNVDILGISELKWTGMGEFNSDNHYI